MSLLQGNPVDGQKLYLLKKEGVGKKMALNIFKRQRTWGATSLIVGLLVSFSPTVAGSKVEENSNAGKEPVSSKESLQVPSSGHSIPVRPHVRINWDKVLPYINAYIHMKPSGNINECFYRSFEDTKFFVGSFEKDYDVTVVWEDKNNIHPDMTEKLQSYVILIQAIRQMTGTDTEAYQTAMQQVTKKISDERAASQ